MLPLFSLSFDYYFFCVKNQKLRFGGIWKRIESTQPTYNDCRGVGREFLNSKNGCGHMFPCFFSLCFAYIIDKHFSVHIGYAKSNFSDFPFTHNHPLRHTVANHIAHNNTYISNKKKTKEMNRHAGQLFRSFCFSRDHKGK